MQGAHLGGPSALPLLWWPVGDLGPHLPARERVPPLIPATQLEDGDLHLLGRLTEASNATWLARLGDPHTGELAIYKPIRGERPLWDFPDGSLAGRERSAYLVSELGGWQVVPPTILRDGPAGPGMVQAWVGQLDAPARSIVHLIRVGSDPAGLRPVLRATDEDGSPLLVAHEDCEDVRSLAVLDCVLNNTDRKGAHVFRSEGRLYAVDHGVTFHAEPKLRTVLWGWAGEELPAAEVARLRALRTELTDDAAAPAEIRSHLSRRELAALLERVDALVATGRFPLPGDDWPAIPWPPI